MSLLQTILQRVNDLTNAFNKMQTDSKLTSELPVASTPISGEELVRIVQNGTSKKVNASFIGGGTGGGGDYDDSWIQPEIDTKVEFKGNWVQASYSKNDWVISGAWMGVAKVDTSEPFPPTQDGSPQWLLPTAPVWENLTAVADIYSGIQFYGVQFNTVDGFRAWSNGNANETLKIYAYEVSATGATTFLDFYDLGSDLPLGWNVVTLDQFGILQPQQKYRLVLETHTDTNTSTLTDEWVIQNAEADPDPGDIGLTLSGLHINQTSDNGTDQSAFLDTLVAGDDILIAESGDTDRFSAYKIVTVNVKTGNVYNYETTLSAQGNEVRDGRDITVEYTHKGVLVSTSYNRIVDQWPLDPPALPDQVQGFVAFDSDTAISPTPGLNNNAYGIDLFYDTYIISPDWFYIAVGEAATNSSGGGTDIEIVDNLTTQDSTKALSANQGYVLDQKIENLDIPPTDDFMTKAAYAPNDANKVDTALNAENLGNELPSKYDQSAHVLDTNIHLSTSERASIEAMTVPPTGDEPFALKSDIDTEIDTTEVVNENVNITGATQDDVNVNVQANKIGLEGGEAFRMTGQIYGGEVITDATSGGNERITTRQLAGFVTYQGVEQSPGSGTYSYSEGLGEDVLTNNEAGLCVAVGFQSLQNNKGFNTIALGLLAGQNNEGATSILVGQGAGGSNLAPNCVLIGSQAGSANASQNSIGVGESSLAAASGADNVGIGFSTLRYVTGSDNLAIGNYAGNNNPMPYSRTVSIGAASNPTQDDQVMVGNNQIESVRVGNPNYVATNQADLVPLSQVAVSSVTGEMTGSEKADNQVVISEANYGDGTGHITGTLYFLT